MHQVRAREGPDAGGLRLRESRRGPDVRRGGARLPRGPAGRALRRARRGSSSTGCSRASGCTRADVFVANVLKCRPPGNRDPLPEEIAACEPHLFRQIELIEPTLVATLGNFATKLLSGRPRGITRVHGHPQEVTLGATPRAALSDLSPRRRALHAVDAEGARGGLLAHPATARHLVRRDGCRGARARRRAGRGAGVGRSSGSSSSALLGRCAADVEVTVTTGSAEATEAVGGASLRDASRSVTSSRSRASSARARRPSFAARAARSG